MLCCRYESGAGPEARTPDSINFREATVPNVQSSLFARAPQMGGSPLSNVFPRPLAQECLAHWGSPEMISQTKYASTDSTRDALLSWMSQGGCDHQTVEFSRLER